MSRLMRRMGTAVVTAALSTVLTGLATPAAVAGCNGNSCTGADPQAMGCAADATTIDEFTYSARFELRYSRACNAAWTRVTSNTTYNTIFAQIRGYNSYPAGIDAPANQVYGVQVVAGQTWTRMVSYQLWVRSCHASWFTGGARGCTGVH